MAVLLIAQLLLLVASVASQVELTCLTNRGCPGRQVCRGGTCRSSSCFPGDALVQTFNGAEVKPMKELRIGDKVVVSKEVDGSEIYSDVYAFGHKDSSSVEEFFEIKMESAHDSNRLELTWGHFVPTQSESKGGVFFKRAEELNPGDIMWATNGNSSLLPYTITEISVVEKQGLFNPLTLSGTILVDGVMASVHSDWFLDSMFDAMGISHHWLPIAYQALLSPVRLLYKMLGPEVYATTYAWLDGYVNVAELGSEYGGTAILAIAIAALASSFGCIKAIAA